MATRLGLKLGLELGLGLLLMLTSLCSTKNVSAGDINWWCNTTPHPGPCKFYFTRDHHHIEPPKHKSDFRQLLVRVAMERALHAHRQVKEFKQHCENKRQKSAWADCFKLYDDTILQLNRTFTGLESNRSCTDFDAQTWLSTALTNIQTCKAGSMELNVSDFISPLLSNNVSELLSNSLAINNGVLLDNNETATYNEGSFPSWVSKNERKLLESTSVRANVVVAKDGSGNYGSIQAAINVAAKGSGSTRFVIYVKRGVYRENIEVGNNVNNVMLVGDGMKNTIITGSRSVGGGSTTYYSATAGINGIRFMARDITFSNTAGPRKGQAVALRSGSDLSVFYRCAFQGYQDTLMVHSQRQFYRECYIYGTIDFIFGNAAVVFQKCTIYARRPLHGQANVITAQGRDDPNQNTGISIQNSRVLAAPDLKPVVREFKTYLGRPWRQYSRTVVIKTYLDSLVHPTGWSTWGDTNFGLNTLYYGEYMNFGPSSSTKWRVRWKGFHAISSANVASRFTVGSFIAGRSWLASTGVPFKSGL